MNRRDVLKLLAGLPLLSSLALPKVKLPEAEQPVPEQPQPEEWKWNGAGDSWKKVDGEWVQVSEAPNWEDEPLYIGGSFTSVGGGSVSRKAFWNGTTWEDEP